LAIFAAIRRALAGLRAAIEAMPFETTRMASVAVGYLTNNTFAERLDRAIIASDRVKLIEGRVNERDD